MLISGRIFHLSIIDVLCCGGFVSAHCKMFSSIPGLHTLNTSNTPQCHGQKCFQTLPNIPLRMKSLKLKNTDLGGNKKACLVLKIKTTFSKLLFLYAKVSHSTSQPMSTADLKSTRLNTLGGKYIYNLLFKVITLLRNLRQFLITLAMI